MANVYENFSDEGMRLFYTVKVDARNLLPDDSQGLSDYNIEALANDFHGEWENTGGGVLLAFIPVVDKKGFLVEIISVGWDSIAIQKDEVIRKYNGDPKELSGWHDEICSSNKNEAIYHEL